MIKKASSGFSLNTLFFVIGVTCIMSSYPGAEILLTFGA